MKTVAEDFTNSQPKVIQTIADILGDMVKDVSWEQGHDFSRSKHPATGLHTFGKNYTDTTVVPGYVLKVKVELVEDRML